MKPISLGLRSSHQGEGVGTRGFGRGAMSGRSERGKIRVGGKARTSIVIYDGVESGGEAWAFDIINQVFSRHKDKREEENWSKEKMNFIFERLLVEFGFEVKKDLNNWLGLDI